MDGVSLGDAASQNVKKRVSKWDLVEDPQFPAKTVQNNSKSGDATITHHDKDLNSGGNLSKSVIRHVPNLSEMEGNHTMKSKDPSGESCWVPIPEGKSEGKDNSVDRGEKISPTGRTWSGDQSYGGSRAPPHDSWRQCSRSRSPKSGWDRSHRSRSRSRSRSPHDFKPEGEGWTDRNRSGRGGSAAVCREFAAGRCRRGYQCRFLHQDDHDYDRRHFDSGQSESRGRRQEKGGFSRYGGDEAFADSQDHGYEGHSDRDREKHERQRNSRSSARCNDFLKGKCYRGSSCRYVHHGANPDGYGGWSSKDATRERGHNRREDTFGHDQRREPRSLCKYFAEGRCRNGERCRFSHQDPSHGGPEGKSQNAGWGDSSMMANRSWEGPRWSDDNSASGAGCPESQLWNGSKWGDNTGDRNLSSNPLSDHPRWGDKDAEKNGYGSPWSSDDNNLNADDPGNRSWKGPSLGDEAAVMNVSNSPRWKSNDSSRRDVSEAGAAIQLRGVDMASAGLISENYSQNIGRKESIYNLQDSRTQNFEAEGQEQHVSSTLTQPVESKSSYIQQHPGLKADAAPFPCEDHNRFSKSNEAHNETNFSRNNLPTMLHASGQCSVESAQNQQFFPPPASNAQSWNPNEENQRMAPPNFLNLNPDGQNQQRVLLSPNVQNLNPSRPNQQMFPQLLSGQNVGLNGQNQPTAPLLLSGQKDLNGQSQQLIMQLSSTAQSQSILDTDESNRNPDLPPEHTPGNSVPQNAMPNEKVTQVTDLSASLAQIFGNGQQLPQLYATLNQLSATGLVPAHPHPQSNPATPSAPNAAPLSDPNQGTSPQKQHDTIQESTESVKPDISNQPPRFPVEVHEQMKLQVAQAITAPSSVTDKPNEGGPLKIGSLEKSNHENEEMSTDTDAVEVLESVTVQCQKEQETGHLKDIDADDQVDEEGKRTKDAKGMKMFKFALVEFIKEILKPTWKEGHMSREAHKTIVKKVVDKVTGSIQGPHVPQTQEKIDQYLSYSKPKLTKLVHAYVEKYMKI